MNSLPGDIGAIAAVRNRSRQRAARFARRGSHPSAALEFPGRWPASPVETRKRRRQAAPVRYPRQSWPQDPTFVIERHPTSNEDGHPRSQRNSPRSQTGQDGQSVQAEVDTKPPRAFPTAETITGNTEGDIATRNSQVAPGSFSGVHLRIRPKGRVVRTSIRRCGEGEGHLSVFMAAVGARRPAGAWRAAWVAVTRSRTSG